MASNPNRQLALIQAGLGGWGRTWLEEAVPAVPGVEVVAVVDPSPAAREQYSGKCVDDLATALETVAADAVLITAPLVAHLSLATQALEAGKHVLVEKPFGPTVAAAEEVVELADRVGRVLAVSQNYRFYPASRTAKRVLTSGELGRLGTARVDFRKWANSPPPEGRVNRHHRLANVLLFDMAIHHFDMMRMILGQEPVEVYAKVTDPPYSVFESVASASLLITFSGGTVVSYRGSWASSGEPTPWSGRWHIECADGELAFSGPEVLQAAVGQPQAVDSLSVFDGTTKSRGGRTPIDLDEIEYRGRAGTLNAFVEAIETGIEPEISGRRNLPTLALCEAAVSSVMTGQPTPVRRWA